MLDAFTNPRLQPLRLASGLVMFAFVLLHFANHAVGLAGLEAMDRVQDWRLQLTHSLPARVLLLVAVLTHMTLGLGKLAARRTLRMPPLEWFQIGSGLLVPALLIPHAVAMGYYTSQTDFFYSYTSVAYLLWPGQALWQACLLLIVWLHACIGIDFWLRTRRWYRDYRPWVFAAAIALPILSLTGFLAAAREAHALFADPAVLARARGELHWPTGAAVADMLKVRELSWTFYAGLLSLVAASYAFRHVSNRAGPTLVVTYAGGPQVKSAVGPSLLEISRMNGIPHTSVCGGRARCSTCRVRIDHGGDALPAPTAAEHATLQRIGAPANIRLACQLRPTTSIAVTRLVAPSANPQMRLGHDASSGEGVERPVAILFLDVRGFTKLSQHRLPFDIVFLLNQFFASVGSAIRSEGGWIDKYMGDGLMAVFGHQTTIAEGCREALAAARAIDLALDDVNHRLSAEVAEGIRIGIGIHAGPVVIGRIGDSATAALTVVGSTVNEASRLEALTKDKDCQLIVSRTVAELAGIDLPGAGRETVEVRGSASKIDIVVIKSARDLPLIVTSEASKQRSTG